MVGSHFSQVPGQGYWDENDAAEATSHDMLNMTITATQKVVLSMKCIWEIVRPGSESKLFQFMLFCLPLEKKFRDQLKWLSLDKEVLIRATEPVFACKGIYPKEIKDLVISMFIIGLFTIVKKMQTTCMSNYRLIF